MAKSLYIGKKSLPSRGRMIANLMAWWAYSQRDPERHQSNLLWYHTAQSDCQALADEFGLTLHTACQVVAAISPGKKWPINIRDARYLIEAFNLYSTEEERIAYLGTLSYQTGYTWENTRNAWHILATGEDIPEERTKTFCFAQNLEFPGLGQRATIDLHMAHILGDTRQRGPVNVNSVYSIMEQVVHDVALVLGIKPEYLQSAVWGARVDAFESGMNVDSLCDLVDSIRTAYGVV